MTQQAMLTVANHTRIAPSSTNERKVTIEYERDFQQCQTCQADAVPCEDWPMQSSRE